MSQIIRNLILQARFSHSATFSTQIKKTCLADLHVKRGGKMVNFAGWTLPVLYRDSAIAASHQHTRTKASIFDVGHMMQTLVSGGKAAKFIESLTTCDLENLSEGCAVLTVFTNEKGGIMDDLIVTKIENDRFFLVSNAGRREEDVRLMMEGKKKFENVNLNFLEPSEQGLIAFQGPASASILQQLVEIKLEELNFMESVETKFDKVPIRVTRCGYTGEDGFEISVPAVQARILTEKLLENPAVKLAGLGARDSLRLEAGLCLYGHDIDESTTPVEAALSWTIAKRRRKEANFPGAHIILQQIQLGVRKKRVGLLLASGPPAREGASILTPEGERVGEVTSGGPSPTLGRPIAMGYMPPELAQTGSTVLVEIRSKTYKAVITKMPFVKSNYYKKPKNPI